MKTLSKFVGKYRVIHPYGFNTVDNSYEFLLDKDEDYSDDMFIPCNIYRSKTKDHYDGAYIKLANETTYALHIPSAQVGKRAYAELKKLEMVAEYYKGFDKKGKVIDYYDDEVECIIYLKLKAMEQSKALQIIKPSANNRTAKPLNPKHFPKTIKQKEYEIKDKKNFDKLEKKVGKRELKKICDSNEEEIGVDIFVRATWCDITPYEYIDKRGLYKEINKLIRKSKKG